MVSGLVFKSLIHFKLTFVRGVREESSLILLHMDIYISQQHFRQTVVSLLCIPGAPAKDQLTAYAWVWSGLFIRVHWSMCLCSSQGHTALTTVAS